MLLKTHSKPMFQRVRESVCVSVHVRVYMYAYIYIDKGQKDAFDLNVYVCVCVWETAMPHLFFHSIRFN